MEGECSFWPKVAKIGIAVDIAKASVAADRILNMRRKDHSDSNLVSLDVGNIGDSDQGVKIEFCNVWFKYPTRDVPVLNGLDLTVRFQNNAVVDEVAADQTQIEKGQFAAIVGPSGTSIGVANGACEETEYRHRIWEDDRDLPLGTILHSQLR